jgi:hypothetical protein
MAACVALRSEAHETLALGDATSALQRVSFRLVMMTASRV